jgi:hypothetical protein
MSTEFVPLFPTTEEASGAAVLDSNRLAALPASDARGRFEAVNLLPTPASIPGVSQSCAAAGQPTVTFQREGDRVTRISVQCSCGQTIELQCEY